MMIARNSAAVSATSRLRDWAGGPAAVRPRAEPALPGLDRLAVLAGARLPDFDGARPADVPRPAELDLAVPLFAVFPVPAFEDPAFVDPAFVGVLAPVRWVPPLRDAPGGGIRTIGSGDSSL
jgi:hypothetical protein